MFIYEYDENTKEYLGCRGTAFMDPVRSEKEGRPYYAVPPNCTMLEPPELEEYEVAIFSTSKNVWTKARDYRGLKGFNKKTKEEVVITEIGELPDYFCEELPVTLQDLKIKKINEIKEAYTLFIQEPVKFKNVFYSIPYREVIRGELANIGDLDVISLELENEEVVVKTKEEAEEILKYLDLWNLLLPLRKVELIAEVKKIKSKSALEGFKIDFDITKEVKKLMKYTPGEIRDYVLGDKK